VHTASRLSKKAQTAKKEKATIANSVGVTAKAESIKSRAIQQKSPDKSGDFVLFAFRLSGVPLYADDSLKTKSASFSTARSRLSKKAQTAKEEKATIANSVGVTAKAESIKSRAIQQKSPDLSGDFVLFAFRLSGVPLYADDSLKTKSASFSTARISLSISLSTN